MKKLTYGTNPGSDTNRGKMESHIKSTRLLYFHYLLQIPELQSDVWTPQEQTQGTGREGSGTDLYHIIASVRQRLTLCFNVGPMHCFNFNNSVIF